MNLKSIDRNLVLILIVFSLAAGFFAFNGALEWDEGSFLLNAEHFSGNGENFEESRPATISLMVSGLWSVTGESVFVARLAILLFGIASITIFYKIAEREFEEPFLPTAFFAVAPLMVYWSARVYTDVPALLFILGSLYAYKKRKFLAAGVLTSLAATFRYLFFIFAFGMAFSFIFEEREKILEYIGGGFIGALPFMSYSFLEYGSPVSKVLMYVTRVTEWSSSGMFAATLPSTVSLVSMISGLIPAAFIGWKDSPTVEKSMLVTYTLFMLLFSGNSFQRYWLAVLPIVLLIGYRGLDRRMFILFSSIMLLTSGIGVASNYAHQNDCSQSLNDALDYAEGFEGKVVTDNWAVTGYRLNTDVYSPWTSMEDLHENYNVSIAIMSSEHNYEVVEIFPGSCRTYRIYNLSIPSS